MSSANAFVSHAINSAFIPRPVPLRYIVDYKEKYIHTIYSPSSHQLKLLASPHVRIQKIKESITNERSSWLLTKFSLSEPLETYWEEYRDYAYRC